MIDFNKIKGFISDMDGVIYHGNQILPGVREFVEWMQKNKKGYLFLTNNSGSTPMELHQKLERMGLDVPPEHFYTSALATAQFLKEQAPGCSAYVIGEAGLLNALYDVGITMNDVNPDYVVVGEGKSYSLDTLTTATNLVLKGAKLIGANSDVSGPIENGIAPACRALTAPIEMATGKKAYFCGKPNPLMMRTGLKLLNCHSAEAVMIGDRMDTDVISGLESGMSTVLVLSGISTKETLDEYGYRPTEVLDGVGDIVKEAERLKNSFLHFNVLLQGGFLRVLRCRSFGGFHRPNFSSDSPSKPDMGVRCQVDAIKDRSLCIIIAIEKRDVLGFCNFVVFCRKFLRPGDAGFTSIFIENIPPVRRFLHEGRAYKQDFRRHITGTSFRGAFYDMNQLFDAVLHIIVIESIRMHLRLDIIDTNHQNDII